MEVVVVLMILGNIVFEHGNAEIQSMEKVLFCEENEVDEVGEREMALGPNSYLCPALFKGEIKVNIR
jgi:hypothetical protein